MAVGNNAEMPFLDHLEELRWRLVWSLVALAIGLGIGFWVVTQFQVLLLLERPITPFLNGEHLKFTNPADPFHITINASLAIGIVLALPVILYQVWAFLAPALYSHEKKVVLPVLFAGAILFLAGAALCFTLILPVTLQFLLGLQAAGLDPMITASEYFGFAISMCLATGAVFELPVVVLLLTALRVVTPSLLKKFRRHAMVLSLVVAAFITPGQDPFSLLSLAVPLYFLYEMSIGASSLVFRRRMRREAADSAPGGAGATA
jgi:sec-independent protein translocase protein TatC